MTARAWWNNEVVAESDDAIEADGTRFFPREDVREGVLRESQTRTTLPGKGGVRYWHVIAGGRLNADAAWEVVDPEPGGEELVGRIAFWHGVEVEEG